MKHINKISKNPSLFEIWKIGLMCATHFVFTFKSNTLKMFYSFFII